MGKTVYILTNFSTYQRSFSPIIVVGEQIKMFKRAGYNPVLIAMEGWEPPEDSVFFEAETKFLYPTNNHNPDSSEQDIAEIVDLTYQQLKDVLPEEGVVITHDLIFLPDYTILNLAARRLAQGRPNMRWLHWVHSATAPNTVSQERAMFGETYAETLNQKFPNSILCYPNAQDIPRVARNFNFEEFEVIEVPHSTDPTEDMHPLVQRLYDEKKLGDCEVLSIYPARLDRGKNPQMLVRAMAGFRDAGITSHVVFCDFSSTGGDKVTLREECKQMAEDKGVADRVTFISEFDDLAQFEVPHKVVLDLFTLSNVFFLPSRSETYSLITQEAMLKGNLCILNYDFPAFRQIYGKKALYRQFDGAEVSTDGFDGKVDTTHSNIDAYFKERVAMAVKAWLENNLMLQAKTWVRTKRNPDHVFREFIEPLLMEQNDT